MWISETSAKGWRRAVEWVDVLRVLGAAFGAWAAVRVEIRWLRSDVNRAHKRLDKHGAQIRALELGGLEHGNH